MGISRIKKVTWEELIYLLGLSRRKIKENLSEGRTSLFSVLKDLNVWLEGTKKAKSAIDELIHKIDSSSYFSVVFEDLIEF
ncbi:MAG: hypothetical protein ACPLYF_00670, partial [Fervidobacterium sp.]